MSEYTAEIAHAAVARGAAWLDEHCPDWVNEINLDRLSLASPTFCVLGQTAKCLLGEKKDGHAKRYGYVRVVNAHWRTLDATDYGFKVPFILDYREERAAYEMLTIAWKEVIRARLEVKP